MKTKIGGYYLHHHDDYLGKQIHSKKEYYEIDFLEFSHKKLKNNAGLIIDIGANIGNHTMYRARKGHVIFAVEPSPDNIEVLRKNCGTLENVATIGRAVSNQRLPFVIESNKENRGEDKVVVSSKSETYTHITDDIQTITKDMPIKLIKIDVEGMELKVLMGASTMIQRFLPDLMVEINDKPTMRYLKRLGYEIKYKRTHNRTAYLSHKIFND